MGAGDEDGEQEWERGERKGKRGGGVGWVSTEDSLVKVICVGGNASRLCKASPGTHL